MRAIIPILVAVCVSTASGQGIPWFVGGYSEAFELAKKLNVPVMVAFNIDNEEANERILKGLYQDKEFIKLCATAVPVIVSNGTHKPAVAKISGRERQVCSRFGYVKCRDHKGLVGIAGTELWSGGNMTAPSHVFLLPDSTEIARILDVASTGSYIDALKKCQKKLGRGLTYAEYKHSLSLEREASRALRANDVDRASTLIMELNGLLVKTPHQARADVLSKELKSKGAAVLARAEAAMEAKEWLESASLTMSAQRAFKGRDSQKAFGDLYRKLRGQRQGRAAIKALEKESKVKKYMQQLEAMGKKNDHLGVAKTCYRVLKTAPGTRSAALARERLTKLESDADIKPLLKKIRASGEPAALFSEARLWKSLGKTEKAAALYDRILDGFAGSSEAKRVTKMRGAKD